MSYGKKQLEYCIVLTRSGASELVPDMCPTPTHHDMLPTLVGNARIYWLISYRQTCLMTCNELLKFIGKKIKMDDHLVSNQRKGWAISSSMHERWYRMHERGSKPRRG